MSRLTRDGTAEPVSRDQILRRVRGQGSADHEQDWQPYPVDSYSCYMRDHTYIQTYINTFENGDGGGDPWTNTGWARERKREQ